MQVEHTPWCKRGCGRRVWNFLTGLCGQCDPETLRAREIGATGAAAVARPGGAK